MNIYAYIYIYFVHYIYRHAQKTWQISLLIYRGSLNVEEAIQRNESHTEVYNGSHDRSSSILSGYVLCSTLQFSKLKQMISLNLPLIFFLI